jgi:hypothetical protein
MIFEMIAALKVSNSLSVQSSSGRMSFFASLRTLKGPEAMKSVKTRHGNYVP